MQSSSVTPSTNTQRQQQPPASPAEQFELKITDMRASRWKSIPREQWKQQNLTISGLEMKEDFEVLQNKIRLALNDGRGLSFVVCNPDRVEVNKSNSSILKNGDSLILLDHRDQPLPFTFELGFNTAPHPKTVTSQKGAYHGTPRKMN